MIDIKSEIIKAIDEKIKITIDNMQFDKTYYGKVESINNGVAIVNINAATYRSKIKDGIYVNVGDVVIVKAPNGNFNYLYVDGKIGVVGFDANSIFDGGGFVNSICKINVELGAVSSSSGANYDDTQCIRSRDFIEVASDNEYYMENNNGYNMYINAYDSNKVFIGQLGRYSNPCVFTTPSTCKYIKFRTSTGSGGQNDLSTKFYIYIGSENPNRLNIGKQGYFAMDNEYYMENKYIDDDTTLPIVNLIRKPTGSINNEYSILQIQAPKNAPNESTLTLMRSNLPNGGAEFIDFTDMDYGTRKACIVVQKRGTGATLCPFDISFNDGTGRRDVFRVHPDGALTEVTNDGIVTGGVIAFNGTLQSTALEHPQILYAGYGEMYLGNPQTQMYIETLNDLKVYVNGKMETVYHTGNMAAMTSEIELLKAEIAELKKKIGGTV